MGTFLGGNEFAGSKLKEKGTAHWDPPNDDATDEYGFTALPGGLREPYHGTYLNKGLFGFWWTSTEESSTHAWRRAMGYDGGNLSMSYQRKDAAWSVRCIKD